MTLVEVVSAVGNKRKTTIMIDDKVWDDLLDFVVKKHHSAKKTSETIETAVKEYLENHAGE